MKKLTLLSIIPLMALTACVWQSQESDDSKPEENLKIVCPTGAPAVAFYKYAAKDNFVTNSVPTNISTYFTTGDADVIVMDTTSGVQAIQKGAQYKIAATITLGNFYLVSTSEGNLELDVDDIVVLFGNSEAVPNKLFTYIYGSDYTVEYAGGGVAKAAQVLSTGTNQATGHHADWVFIAEPYLYSVKNNSNSVIYNKNVPIINIQDAYSAKAVNLPLMQASVFIKNTVSRTVGDKFLSNLKKDIEEVITSPANVMNYMGQGGEEQAVEAKYGVSPLVAKEVMTTNGLGLGYLNSLDNKSAIDHYLGLFGIQKTNADNIW